MIKKEDRSRKKEKRTQNLSVFSDVRKVEDLYRLGLEALKQQNWPQARAALEAVLARDPRHRNILSNLGGVYYILKVFPQAEEVLCLAIQEEPANYRAHFNLGMVFKERGKLDEAEACFRKTLTLMPDHASASQMLAALSGGSNKKPHDGFIQGLFDQYAKNFDAAMTDGLHCKASTVLAHLTREQIGVNAIFDHVLDLGCGTGLSGLPFRVHAKKLVGVDLSKNMLDLAKEKEIYNALYQKNIEVFLAETEQYFDLIVLADVLVYMGDLGALFDALDRVLSEGGIVVFSTECAEEDDYVLLKSGRYAHSRKYVDAICSENNYRLLKYHCGLLRSEYAEQIIGNYYLIRKENSSKK